MSSPLGVKFSLLRREIKKRPLPFCPSVKIILFSSDRNKRESISVSPHWLPGHVVGRSPQIIDFAVNYEQNRHMVQMAVSMKSVSAVIYGQNLICSNVFV
jgi:hypothetical protein